MLTEFRIRIDDKNFIINKTKNPFSDIEVGAVFININGKEHVCPDWMITRDWVYEVIGDHISKILPTKDREKLTDFILFLLNN